VLAFGWIASSWEAWLLGVNIAKTFRTYNLTVWFIERRTESSVLLDTKGLYNDKTAIAGGCIGWTISA
jgi:hypothetical protein